MDKLATRLARVSLASTSTPLASSSSRLFSTASTARAVAGTASYPFSSNVQVIPPPRDLSVRPDGKLPQKHNLICTLNHIMTAQHPKAKVWMPLFSRRDKQRLRPGSILTVETYATAPTPENPKPSTSLYSGVMIGIRRRHEGRDLSIRLRTLVGRLHVEQVFKVFSPLVKSIKIVQRATRSGPVIKNKDGTTIRRKPVLKAARRAQMYYVRDQPDRLPSVAGFVKAQRLKEEGQGPTKWTGR
ncbi:putative 50s ribosomal protein l19 [Rhodotorula toruloides ATCC 204091]|uniref:Putative 50s ribosomal protein l19 n=1 Tax=Rhodotorula toruloides TaxID=5286 RepID=A0A0K3CG46_RHOTO|nr:putative 50s ribosomal protein l19 [Rhodotorula toruloides ATCC 204091]KAK4335250.1 putative 50s ribosomal protein l19 [Rhodotorula toruloides]PRQ74505.1 putative 50s ribosomal protein l19 [Rhodotorula toruloides]